MDERIAESLSAGEQHDAKADSSAMHPLDDALEERDEESNGDEDDEDDEDEGEDDDASSYTSASALEEEALYADQPACGLSPRLVVRRGVQTLLAADAASGKSQVPASSIQRVDTVASFERAMQRAGPLSLVAPVGGAGSGSGTLPASIARITSLSGLQELAEAEAAVEGEGGDDSTPGGSSSATTTTTTEVTSSRGEDTSTSVAAATYRMNAAFMPPPSAAATRKAEPLEVRRIDTMELLTADDLVEDAGGAATRQRSALRSGAVKRLAREPRGEDVER